MPTFHIHIRGQVQGVGFRPFVYQMALRAGLHGWVNNSSDGVHIELNGSPEIIRAFAAQLEKQAPRLSRITGLEVQEVAHQVFDSFSIVHSQSEQAFQLLLSPDFALCPDCRMEMLDPANRRFGYPFITCTHCGPRYSIVQALPYDRERTVMDAFPPCPACAAEYADPFDRRYYSQTNSCPVCGIQLGWFDLKGSGAFSRDSATVFSRTKAALEAGKIVAAKGIGGYLLLLDASNAEGIAHLRLRKRRPSKPFALLYPGIKALEADLDVSEQAREALMGPVAPIVLLPMRENPASALAYEQIAPGLRHLGVMLPYAPLLEALMQVFPRPLIATSGNISNSPIVFEDENVFEELNQVADYILTHDRPIAVPQDDSVLRFTPRSQQAIWLRRSRGMAPTLLLEAASGWKGSYLAAGADMKSAFAWLLQGNTYISQYLGDLDNWETQHSFRHTLNHFMDVFQAKPEGILADLHPGYFSSQLARDFAADWNLPLFYFQHHKAHFGAILAEHALFSAEEPVLGVIFDGTGLGDDRNIWGGEFFLYAQREITHLAQLAPFPHLGGDKMAREPRICAWSVGRGIPGFDERVRAWFSESEWKVYQKLMTKKDGLHTSSMGRLFDGVAALCGFPLRCSYEGEAAMLLETAALSWFEREGWDREQGYFCEYQDRQISVAGLVQQVIADLEKGESTERIAARFHGWIVRAVERMAEETGVSHIACSGGVFQNAVLIELLTQRLGPGYRLYVHRQLSANDENICVGQLALFQEGILPANTVPYHSTPNYPVV